MTFNDSFPTEYSTYGLGGFREDCLRVRDVNWYSACSLQYKSHSILSGKPLLKGLPATFSENAVYRDEESGEIYSGRVMMYAGFNITGLNGDFTGKLIHLEMLH